MGSWLEVELLEIIELEQDASAWGTDFTTVCFDAGCFRFIVWSLCSLMAIFYARKLKEILNFGEQVGKFGSILTRWIYALVAASPIRHTLAYEISVNFYKLVSVSLG